MSPQVDVEMATPNNEYTMQTEAPVERSLWDDCVLECVGTAFFVYLSIAGVNQAVLSALSSGSAVNEIHVSLCFMMGLATGITFALKSGAHLNPAVSFTMWLAGEISFGKFVVYMISQIIGGFLGSLLVMALYYSRINTFADHTPLVGTFGTLKNPDNSLFSSILDQIIGSALLMIGIMHAPNTKWKPLAIGLVLGTIGLVNGSNGFALNLARDLPVRIVSTIAFGNDPFTLESSWFWVPTTMSFLGCPLGWIIAKAL